MDTNFSPIHSSNMGSVSGMIEITMGQDDYG